MDNLSRAVEWRDWVSWLNSRLSFYYHLPVVGKCLEKSLKGDHIEMSITYFQVQNWMSEIVRPQKVDQNMELFV